MRGVVPNSLFIFIKYNIIYIYIRVLDAVTRKKWTWDTHQTTKKRKLRGRRTGCLTQNVRNTTYDQHILAEDGTM